MTIDHRKLVALTTENTPYTEFITSTDGYQVTDTVTRYTKPVFLIGGATPGTDIDNLPAVPGSSCFNTVTFPKDLGPDVTTNPTKIFDLRRNDCGTPTTIDLNPLN